jgi:hypothetical protein
MKTRLIGAALALGLATVPLASFAGGVGGGNANSNWTIYGWQNWAMDFRSVEPMGGSSRDSILMEGEAANIGFAASIDTGVSVAGTPVKANFQCEQFTWFNRIANFNHSTWCSRNSKLGLSGPWGEVMFSGWLTPYNEITAQWIDPFYDAGSHTHSTLLGNVGWGVNYGNTGFDGTGYGDNIGGQGFMRRKDNMYQWFSPNWGGLAIRVGWSNNNRFADDETAGPNGEKLDPTILSVGIAYTTAINETDELWLGFGYQEHDEFAAVSLACADSNDETMRLATRYIHDWGNGHSTRLSLAYEEMEYDWDGCTRDLNAEMDGMQGGGGPFDYASTGGVVDFEREAWLVSGKHDFPGPMDFRFMYMEADDFDCGANMATATTNCGGINENSSGADAFSVGLYYTMPAGTELRMVYGEVDNDANSANGFGISSAGGVGPGGTEESFQFGVVQWF